MAVGTAKKTLDDTPSEFCGLERGRRPPRPRAPVPPIAGLVARAAYPGNQSSLKPSPGPPPTGGHALTTLRLNHVWLFVTAGRDRRWRLGGVFTRLTRTAR